MLRLTTALTFSVLLMIPATYALPVLTCRGDLPVFALRLGQYVLLTRDDHAILDPRVDGSIYIGPHPDRPWLKLHLSQPLTWERRSDNYGRTIDLKIRTDMLSYFGVRAEELVEPSIYTLDCAVAEDGVRRPAVVRPSVR